MQSYINKGGLPLFIGNCTGLNGLIGLHKEVSIVCVLLLTTLADGRHKSPAVNGFEITFVVWFPEFQIEFEAAKE